MPIYYYYSAIKSGRFAKEIFNKKAECYYTTALVWGQIGLAHSCIYKSWQVTFKTSNIFQTYLLTTFTIRVHWNLSIPTCLNDKEACQKVIRDGLNQFSKIKNYINLYPIKNHRSGGSGKKYHPTHSLVFVRKLPFLIVFLTFCPVLHYLSVYMLLWSMTSNKPYIYPQPQLSKVLQASVVQVSHWNSLKI